MQRMTKTNSELLGLLQRNIFSGSSKKRSERGLKAVIYTRVSTKEQADNNGSLQTQLAQCLEYAVRRKIEVIEKFGGVFESASTDGRKEFQRMLAFVKKNKDVSVILVHNYDRFSRTGPSAMQLTEELRRQGVLLRSVTQELDPLTSSGRLMENFHHLINRWDNDTKGERTKRMTREVMLKGYWPYATPLGYLNLKPKHRACLHEYVITEEGKLLRQAFQMKAKGTFTNRQIIDHLSKRGLRITEKNFRWVLSNVFYAGFVTGNLVDHQLTKGKHPPLVDMKTFMEANKMMRDETNVGVPKCTKQEELPLKIFAKEEGSNAPFTGYIKKGNWYYKARQKGVGVNVNANILNEAFKNFLSQFQYKRQYHDVLKKKILSSLQQSVQDKINDTKKLKKRESELETEIEKLELKYINEAIPKTLYDKWLTKFSEEKAGVQAELQKVNFDSSNLERMVEKGLAIAQNVSGAWVSMRCDEKQRLQSLVFPEGILYSKEKGTVRTNRVNSLFAAIPYLTRVCDKNKKGNSKKNCQNPDKVPGTGIEPAHP